MLTFLATTKASKTPFSVDSSEVMRAIADANEASVFEKVSEERMIAKKMETLETTASVNESINNNISSEEQQVIEATNERLSNIHSKK